MAPHHSIDCQYKKNNCSDDVNDSNNFEIDINVSDNEREANQGSKETKKTEEIEETQEIENIPKNPPSWKSKLFPCKKHEDEEEHDHNHSVSKLDLIRIGLVAIAVALSVANVWKYIPNVPFDIIGLIATVIGGYPIYKEAFFDGILHLQMNMELSMTIALVAAMCIEQFETSTIIVLFVLIAEVLEGLTVGQGRKALKKLTDILPKQIFILDPETKEIKEISASSLKLGDLVVIKPGARIPVDGKVY